MNRFVLAALVALTTVAMFPTSASAFKCVAAGTNGISLRAMSFFRSGPCGLPCATVVLQEGSIARSVPVDDGSMPE